MKTTNLRPLLLAALIIGSAAALALADSSCVNCHSKQEGALGVPTHDWPTSIHFANGISCSDCHGGDPKAAEAGDAMNPARGFKGKPSKTGVPDFCGKCHAAIKDNFVTSAHSIALQAGIEKAPNCVTCHTAHKQQKVTLNLINPTTCGQCHTYERAGRLKDAMSGMEDRLTNLESRENKVFLEGMNVDQETKTLMDVRNRTHRLTHILDIPHIKNELALVQPDLQTLDRHVKEKEKTVTDRKALGTGIMALFLVGAVIAWMTHKRIDNGH